VLHWKIYGLWGSTAAGWVVSACLMVVMFLWSDWEALAREAKERSLKEHDSVSPAKDPQDDLDSEGVGTTPKPVLMMIHGSVNSGGSLPQAGSKEE